MLKKIRAIFLWSVTFTLVPFVAGVILPNAPIAVGAPPAGKDLISLSDIATRYQGMAMLLVAPDGRIDLRDEPAGAGVRFTAEAGTQVRVQDVALAEGVVWFLVRGEFAPIQGWVPAAVLQLPGTTGPNFRHFEFCAGDVAAPSDRCGERLSLESPALWLAWEYSGLKPGDVVQRVLLVNGERYQSEPLIWNSAPNGKQLVDLLAEHQPRVEAGSWTVWFIVNGEFAGQSSFQLP